jgi:hypothetical protein
MDDSDDSTSDTSETILVHFDDDELPRLPDEIVEDLTDGIDDFLSDEGSLSSLSLAYGAPVIRPRPYQLEMVEESLKKNIIVAVGVLFRRLWTRLTRCSDGHRQWQNPCVRASC